MKFLAILLALVFASVAFASQATSANESKPEKKAASAAQTNRYRPQAGFFMVGSSSTAKALVDATGSGVRGEGYGRKRGDGGRIPQ